MSLQETFLEYDVLDHHTEFSKNWIVVNWCLGNTCNFACSYCPKGLHDGSFGWGDFETIKTTTQKIIDHYYPKNVYFEFTGGEVTLWKHFIQLVDFIKSTGNHVGMITNASRTIRWWETNKSKFDHVCLSFHSEHSDPEHYLEVAEIMSKECRTHCNVMIHNDPKYFDICRDLSYKLIGIKNISIAIQPLIIDFGSELYSYTQEQQEFIDNQWENIISKIEYTQEWPIYRGSMIKINSRTGEQSHPLSPNLFISNETNNWNGWKCNAGLEQIVIDFNGSIMRGWCKVGGIIGNTMDPNNIQFPTNSVVCNKTMCHCNFDIMCKKFKA